MMAVAVATSSAREIAGEITLHVHDDEPLDQIRRELRAVAEDAAEYARSIAPVDEGDYKKSIHTEDLDDVNGLPARRVIADDYKAIWIEYGTKEPGPTPEFAVFAKTADHFGGDQRGGGFSTTAESFVDYGQNTDLQ